MIKFGVAGYPPAFHLSPFKKDRLKIFEWIKSLGLDAFEAQMTYGPRTLKENCIQIKHASEDFNVKVSIHASYFIVFTSNEKTKIEQSIDTLKRTFDLANLMGSNVIVLHPGPLYGQDSIEVMARLKDNLHAFFHDLGNSEIGLFLETAGKRGQLGSVDEVLELSSQVKGCYPCVDFGHVHARTGGTLKDAESIDALFAKMDSLGAFEFGKIHFHYTPIHYGPKGEICHKAIEDKYETSSQLNLSLFEQSSDDFYHPRYNQIIKNLIDRQIDCTIISETHDSQERGALAMKKLYNEFSLLQKPTFT